MPILLDETILNLLPRRHAAAHKGDFGHVLLIGGNRGMMGAILMAAIAAARSGAGLISVATHREHALLLTEKRPEIMFHAVSTEADVLPLLNKATVVAIGPGLGQDEWATVLWQAVQPISQPLIVDADGLNLLAQHPYQNPNWILTPHVGEAARLLHTTIEAIQTDRMAAVTDLQQRYDGIAILKGAHSLIKSAMQLAQCNAGNPGMASGGMGDILTGIIASLVAQGLSVEQAAQCGVYLHARAGDIAAQQLGERGLLATDLFPYIQQLVNTNENRL